MRARRGRPGHRRRPGRPGRRAGPGGDGPARHRARGPRPARRSDLDGARSPAPTSSVDSAAPGSTRTRSRRSPPEIARYGLAMRSYPKPTTRVWVDGDRRSRQRELGPGGMSVMRAFDPTSRRSPRASLTADRARAIATMADLDIAVSDWVATQAVTEAARDGHACLRRRHGRRRPDEIAFLPLVVDAIENGYRLAAGWSDIGVSFVGGTRRLVDALASGLDVRLDQSSWRSRPRTTPSRCDSREADR